MLNPNYFETLDDFEMTPEEEEEAMTRHIANCKAVEYCKICAEY